MSIEEIEEFINTGMGDDGYGAWRLWEVLKPEWERLNRETVEPWDRETID